MRANNDGKICLKNLLKETKANSKASAVKLAINEFSEKDSGQNRSLKESLEFDLETQSAEAL